VLLIPKVWAILSAPDPYEPAGSPVKMEMKQVVMVTSHLYLIDQLNLVIYQLPYMFEDEIDDYGLSGSSGPSQSTISILSSLSSSSVFVPPSELPAV